MWAANARASWLWRPSVRWAGSCSPVDEGLSASSPRALRAPLCSVVARGPLRHTPLRPYTPRLHAAVRRSSFTHDGADNEAIEDNRAAIGRNNQLIDENRDAIKGITGHSSLVRDGAFYHSIASRVPLAARRGGLIPLFWSRFQMDTLGSR
jgi:hypothetical protein